MKTFKFTEIIKNVYHFNFDTQEECAKTFCRFEEYYESPFWQGKIFTLDQYKEWYIKTYGQWSYYTDWNGFNIPDYAFKPFFYDKFKNITKEEKKVLKQLPLPNSTEKYYVIATHNSGESTLKHELAHALYYVNEEYFNNVYKILLLHDYPVRPLYDWMIEEGYTISSALDEFHAYLLEYEDLLRYDNIENYIKDTRPYEKVGKLLQENFNKFYRG
jgi:hypothetical protein